MTFSLRKFNILGLHGDMDVKIRINDNKLVIVAENGLGKTTIVNIIFYTLSQQWYKLGEYQFDEINFNINLKEFVIRRNELNDYIKLRKLRGRSSYRNRYNPRLARVTDYILETNSIQDLLNNPSEVEIIARRFDISSGTLYELCQDLRLSFNMESHEGNLEEIADFLTKNITSQILYLPTYRRIEKDLKNIFPDLETNLDTLRNKRLFQESENAKKHIELVEFGMDDVQAKVDQKLNSLYINFTENLRQSLMGSYLKDILNKNYELHNYNFLQKITTRQLTQILGRIDNSILQIKEKESLMQFVGNYKVNSAAISNEDKMIAYFIQKLIDIYETQSIEESDVVSFVEICNTYCTNKQFIYSRAERKIKIYLTEQDKEISFSKLSSGEKQIVSLFSHLYLSDNKDFFIIIDEPELSLSVTWQERFLTDIQSAYNAGLIAVTHSPYIFSNNLENYTKSFNEFITINK